MNITILTTGSRGDTQPYIALGVALQQAGQQVRLAAFENYANFVRDYSLEFFPIRGDVAQVALSDQVRAARQADNPLKLALSFNQLKGLVTELQQDFYHACQGADVIVYHPGAAIGYFIAQSMNVPSVLATPFPMTPTRAYPSLIFYHLPRFGKEFNFLSHKIFEQIMWFASSAAIKQFWKQTFGQVPAHFGNPFSRQNTPERPTIIACSRHVFPTPDDWPSAVYNSGYWFLDELGGWQPPKDLLDFLEGGPAPVYVGFGSVGDPQQAADTTRLVAAALQKAGQRGVLATGWQGMAQMEALPDEIYMLESAPHSWLFPRMAAVVHHGGAGTTAAGLRAGVPGVVIPFSNDQFAWGQRVYELGVGAQPIPRKKLTAENLSQAVKTVSGETIRRSAAELGAKIRSENGAQAASTIILECLEQTTSGETR